MVLRGTFSTGVTMKAATRLGLVWTAAMVLLVSLTGCGRKSDVVEAQWEWRTNADNTITMTKYTGSSCVVAVPNRINRLLVTGIDFSAFRWCSNLTNLIIPVTVTNIQEGPLPLTLTTIIVDSSNSVFSSAEGILFDKNRKRLILFPRGKVGNMTIPEGVVDIGRFSFAYCESLNSIVMPASVTNIESFAFVYCTNLMAVFFKGNAPHIGEYAFCCNGDEKSTVYYLPSTKDWGKEFGDRPTVVWKQGEPNAVSTAGTPQ